MGFWKKWQEQQRKTEGSGMDEEYTEQMEEDSIEERKAGPALVIRNLLVSLAAIILCFVIGLWGGKALAAKKEAAGSSAAASSAVTSEAATSEATSAAV
jgi:hypothetical protein